MRKERHARRKGRAVGNLTCNYSQIEARRMGTRVHNDECRAPGAATSTFKTPPVVAATVSSLFVVVDGDMPPCAMLHDGSKKVREREPPACM